MKKLILVLAIALIATPSFGALSVGLVRNGDNVDVVYSGAGTTAATRVRAFALDLLFQTGATFTGVTGYKTTGEGTPGNLGYGIYPAKINIDSATGSVVSYGTPAADTTTPDPGAGSAIPASHIVLEFGSLYYGEVNAPPTSGTLCTLTVNPGAISNPVITMTDELTYRGGVVYEDGTQDLTATDKSFTYTTVVPETITTPTVTKTTAAPAVANKVNGGRVETFVATGATSNLSHTLQYQFTWGDAVVGSWGAATQTHTYTYAATGSYTVTVQARCATDTAILSAVSANYVVTREAVKSSNATIYAAWADFGRPNCWAFQRSCHGDADGIGSGIGAAKIWTNATDLNILSSGYNKNVANLKLASFGGVAGVCADGDRTGSGIGAAKIWVNSTDLTNLSLYYNKNVAGNPVCAQTNYWFWTN